MGLRPSEIFLLLQCGDRLQSSESDVYRRQILTTKVDSRAVRVNTDDTSTWKAFRLNACYHCGYLRGMWIVLIDSAHMVATCNYIVIVSEMFPVSRSSIHKETI